MLKFRVLMPGWFWEHGLATQTPRLSIPPTVRPIGGSGPGEFHQFLPRSARMSSPSDRVYSESHEWFKSQGDMVTVGITRFAVDALTDVTYAQMKPKGTAIKPGDSLGEIESVKTTSDVYSLVEGTIEEVNASVADDPSILNSDPYEKGWLVKIRVKDAGQLSKAMDAKTYDSKHAH